MAKQDRELQTVDASEVGVLESPAPAPVVDIPTCTARTAFAGRLQDPIMKAFISCEERVHGTRKLPESEWKAALETFMTAPR